MAAGLASAAQGSDGGGSIRIPASVCGLVGLKPSRYRVSSGPLGDLLGELTVEGPIGRTVADVAALLDVMAEPFADDPTSLVRPSGGFLSEVTRLPARLRIGRYAKPVISNAPVDRECLAAFESATELLVDLGHEVVDIDPPFDDSVVPLFETIWASLALWAPIPQEQEAILTPLTRWLREKGRGYSGFDIATAVSTIRLLSRAALRSTAEFDAVLTPTLAAPPAFIGQLRNDQDPAADFEAQKAFTPFTSPYNVTGQPAITLPLYWTEQGLPIGIQLVGRIAEEGPLLALAAQLESARPWIQRKPACW
ncbi:MAG: amidase [Actinomycetes bacterium]